MKITRERLEQILKEELAAVTEGERDYAENETEHVDGARGPLQKEGGAQGHMGGDVPLSVLAAGGEEAREAVMAAYEQGSREFELAMMVIAMAEKQGMIAEGMPPELMNGGTPPIENELRARQLLNGFKKMLKPEEKAEPSACAIFLRQLANLAEREGGSPDAGTGPNN